MPTVFEALQDNQELPLHEAVAAGADILSGEQEISFTPYVRRVLPIDGFVFGHPLTRYSTFKDDGKMYPLGSQKPFVVFHQYFDSEFWWKRVRDIYRA